MASVATPQGAVVLDVGSRRLLGYATGDRIDTRLVADTLDKAANSRAGRTAGIVFHSDHRSQYLAGKLRKTAAGWGLAQWFGRVGSSADNAVAEAFFSSLKRELVNRRRYPDRTTARRSVLPSAAVTRGAGDSTQMRRDLIGDAAVEDAESSLKNFLRGTGNKGTRILPQEATQTRSPPSPSQQGQRLWLPELAAPAGRAGCVILALWPPGYRLCWRRPSLSPTAERGPMPGRTRLKRSRWPAIWGPPA